MLTTNAFNALLKTLEEPPPKSLFVFATTNPEKIPFTVLSRCQRHDLRRIALASVSDRLAEICKSEGIKISPGALSQIAREGDGSMRDAQTLLDQIIAYGGETITDETIAEVLDLVDRRVLHQIIEACIDGDAKTALESVAQATSGGSEARRIADSLLELLRDLVVLRVAPDGQGLFDGPDEERADLIELASRTEPARLRRMFRALVREIEDLSWAPRPTAVLEMAVIRLATLPSGDDAGQLLARLDQLERKLSAGNRSPTQGAGQGGRQGGGGGSTNRDRPISDRGPRRRTESRPASKSEPKAADTPPASPRASTAPEPQARPAKPAKQSRAESSPSAPSPLGGGASPEAIFDRLRAKALEADRSRYASLEGTELISIKGNTIELGVSAPFHAERLRDRISDLEAFAGNLLGQPTRITVEVRTARSRQEETSESREHSRKRRQEALNSEPVNLAIEILDAEIVEIRPLGENR